MSLQVTLLKCVKWCWDHCPWCWRAREPEKGTGEWGTGSGRATPSRQVLICGGPRPTAIGAIKGARPQSHGVHLHVFHSLLLGLHIKFVQSTPPTRCHLPLHLPSTLSPHSLSLSLAACSLSPSPPPSPSLPSHLAKPPRPSKNVPPASVRPSSRSSPVIIHSSRQRYALPRSSPDNNQPL